MSPEFPVAWVPITASLEMASPPTDMSVQSAPRLPFARLKLSEKVAANALCGTASRSSEVRRGSEYQGSYGEQPYCPQP